MEHIVPLVNDLDDAMDKCEVKDFGNAEIEVVGDSLKMRYKLDNFDEIKTLVLQVTRLLNSLEGFSTYFASGSAEESVAFSSVGCTFISSVERLLPVLCALQESGSYRNVMKLYVMWKDQIEKQNAIMEKSEAEKKLNQECIIQMKAVGI